MARARNIKPSFFTNDVLVECDYAARLLFIGLWTIADREGRLEDRPKRIKIELLPYDDCDCDKLLNQLHKHGFIVRYKHDDNAYIQVLNFSKHQNPHMKEQASTIPAPDMHGASTVLAQPITDSLNPITDSLNPIKEVVAVAPRSPKGSRLPNDWVLPDEWGHWAESQGMQRHDILQEEEKFRDYWIARTGKEAIKADWQATWRNWIRRRLENGLQRIG